MGSCLGVGFYLRLLTGWFHETSLSTYPGLCSVIIIKLLSARQEGQEEAFATNSHNIFLNTLKNRKFIHSSPAPVCWPGKVLCPCDDQRSRASMWWTGGKLFGQQFQGCYVDFCSLVSAPRCSHAFFFITCTAYDWDEVSVILNRTLFCSTSLPRSAAAVHIFRGLRWCSAVGCNHKSPVPSPFSEE